MVNMSDLSGYVASMLVLLTFMTRNMRLLRIIAILSNVAFITYGALDWLPPVLILHALLLPLNIVRLKELQRSAHDSDRSILAILRNSAFMSIPRPSAARSLTTRPHALREHFAISGTSL